MRGRNWPWDVNLFDHLVVRHARDGRTDAPALLAGDVTITYGELADRVARAATVLRNLGCARGDYVVLLLPDTPSFVTAFFAALHIGAVAVPVNPASSYEDVAHIVDRVRATIAIVDGSYVTKFDRLADAGVRLLGAGDGCARRDAFERAVERASADAVASSRVEDAIAYCLFSSGTTGRPKGIPHRHADILEGAIAYSVPVLSFSSNDRVLAVPKLTFGYGLGGNLLSALFVGAASILVEAPSSAASMAAAAERYAPTVFLAQPRLIVDLLRMDSLASFASLRLAVTAGEVLSGALYARWRERGGCELLDGFGSTEVGHVFISNRIGDVRPGCAGRPIDGFDVRLGDEPAMPAPDGVVAEIWVRGPSLAHAYSNEPERSSTCFFDGWFRTGDLGYRDQAGYITICGRADDMIKTGCGQWVSPLEIEAVIADQRAVADCAVVGYSNALGVVALKVCVVLAPQTRPDPELEECLKSAVAARFEELAHKRIDIVEFVSALPRNAMGKLERYRLKPASLTEFSYQC